MSTRSNQTILLTSALILAGGVAYYVSRPSSHHEPSISNSAQFSAPTQQNALAEKNLSAPPARSSASKSTITEVPPHALANERIIRFNNEADYLKFLASLDARSLRLLGRSDRLRAVRIGLGSGSNLDGIDGAEIGYNYLVTLPTPPNASAQASATGFGSSVLSWLGVKGDNLSWGEGITVAVIDSGVNEHIALKGNITRIELTELSEGSSQLGHGTAVASIISGDHPLTQGVAPDSDILSIRITDETGSSNSFTLAEAIFQAVDAGADIINISMGSEGNSTMVEEAVLYAKEQGTVIVAAAGNNGLNQISFPAGYESVISVGAVEQGGKHLDFSNSGPTLDISAPGYQINAAWGSEQLTAFSGTSGSAPLVSGAIAAGMSQYPNLSASEVADLVVQLSGDAGYPGSDPNYGNGILDLGQLMNYGTPGIYDAAITGQVLVAPEFPTGLPEVWVTIQNQGTETLINSPVTITTSAGIKNLNISSLAPGDIQTFNIPVLLPHNGDPITLSSSVQSAEQDQDPSNNSRSDQFSREAP